MLASLTLLSKLRELHPDWHFIDEPVDTWTSLKKMIMVNPCWKYFMRTRKDGLIHFKIVHFYHVSILLRKLEMQQYFGRQW